MSKKEIWRPIILLDTGESYEGFYEVSNLGRVKSLNYNRTGKEKILKPHKTKNGYLEIELYKDGKGKRLRINRLVAFAFIPNPENKPHVDHINTIKTDNRVVNLRWVTPKENMNNEITREHLSEVNKGEKNHMFGKHHSEEHKKKLSEANSGEGNPMYGKRHSEETKGKISEALKDKYTGENSSFFGKHHSEKAKKKIGEASSKKVICIETGQVFDSLTKASEYIGVGVSAIGNCLSGRSKTCAGFHWAYYEEEVEANVS